MGAPSASAEGYGTGPLPHPTTQGIVRKDGRVGKRAGASKV
ncbi:hypothetical protein A6F65_01303 [Paraurantiacibacter namhicola]|uniref:Uncharacterized protein n=1 Tax=Paraurantiacibacter namhicola TaxID=645517 RepID=A0A1C7D801_9SPHN|nr:hypothetical protein A6F65_01303 [Paraurantiacibacter namhicola]